jgi:arylsulfatase A-like enzyme
MHAVRHPLVLATVLALAVLASPAAAAERSADHVVLISIDGLLSEYVVRPEDFGVRLPSLQALRDRGSFAEGVIGQYPSLTYPSHTSLVTGVRPARHGIVSNNRFEPPGPGSWYFEASAITAPTLWQLAGEAGLVTAGVSWPVTRGAAIDVNFPELNQGPETWIQRARAESFPGLVDAVLADLGDFEPGDNLDPRQRDRFATAAAVRILGEHRPNLLLVHLMQTDAAQHSTGKHTPESLAAFERVDAHLGELVAAAAAAGILERTAFVVTGDHGFHRIHSTFQPDVALRDAGLIDVDGEGAVTGWRAISHRASIRLADPADAALAARVETLFRGLAEGPYRGLLRVIGRDQLDALGADPAALLFLEPVEGYSISGGFRGDAFLVATGSRGSHGYLPTLPAMHTGLVVSGAGVRQGVVLPIARQIDVAPTIARLLGLDMADVEGVPMAGILE